MAKVTSQVHSNVHLLEGIKVCAKCKDTLPMSSFSSRGASKDGLRGECKTCASANTRRLQQERREYFAEYQKSSPKAQQTQMVATAKARAKRQGVPFNLTKKDLEWPTHCPVLGIELIYRGDDNAGGLQAGSPTIDKIIPSEGYVKGNVMIMSHLANRMKNNATPEQLRAFAEWVGATYE